MLAFGFCLVVLAVKAAIAFTLLAHWVFRLFLIRSLRLLPFGNGALEFALAILAAKAAVACTLLVII